jgi:glucose/arabinose dehydrogenase
MVASRRGYNRNDIHAILETLMTGLDSPRGLTFGPDGALYVAEATTGAVSRIGHRQSRVVSGLPSIAEAGGRNAIGPSDVSYRGQLYFTVGRPRSSADPMGPLRRHAHRFPVGRRFGAGVPRGGSQHVVAELVSPGGLAIRGWSAYMSNCGTCPGDGSVVKIRL